MSLAGQKTGFSLLFTMILVSALYDPDSAVAHTAYNTVFHTATRRCNQPASARLYPNSPPRLRPELVLYIASAYRFQFC